MKEYVKPTVTIGDGPMSEEKEVHPAYGQIAASRVQGSARLYGSDFEHRAFVRIEIRASEQHRNLSHDWFFGRDVLCEVYLSEAQWATFVSSLNAGMGVPCTLDYVHGMGEIPGIDRTVDRKGQAYKELTSKFDRAMERINKLGEEIENLKLSGKAKDELQRALSGIHQELGSNTKFVAESFDKHMEDTVEKAKIEVNAYVHHMMARTGFKRLTDVGVVQLPEGKPSDGE